MINREEVLKGNSGIEDADETYIDDVKKSLGMGEIGNASNAEDKSSSSPTDDVDILEREERLKGNDGISDTEDSNLKVQSPTSSNNLSLTTSNVNEPISVVSEDIDFIKNKKDYHSFVVTFDFESIEVKSSEMDILNKVVKVKQNNPNSEIIVCGYTCDYGSNDVNNWISQYRTISVKNELKKLGINEGDIKLYWYGKTKNNPQSTPNKSNRKCEILIKR
jgi:outer membrane protein OmpA-like peptidoglycan-associated protein